MCAKFCGFSGKMTKIWASAGPVLCYGRRSNFAFFQLFDHFDYFWLRVPMNIYFPVIKQLLWAQLRFFLLPLLLKNYDSMNDRKCENTSVLGIGVSRHSSNARRVFYGTFRSGALPVPPLISVTLTISFMRYAYCLVLNCGITIIHCLAEWRNGGVSVLPSDQSGFASWIHFREKILASNYTLRGQNIWGRAGASLTNEVQGHSCGNFYPN